MKTPKEFEYRTVYYSVKKKIHDRQSHCWILELEHSVIELVRLLVRSPLPAPADEEIVVQINLPPQLIHDRLQLLHKEEVLVKNFFLLVFLVTLNSSVFVLEVVKNLVRNKPDLEEEFGRN